MAETEAVGVSGKQAYTLVLSDPPRSYMKVDVRDMPVGPGADPTNSVVRIERQGEYETVAASQADQVLGATGAAGDYLEKLVVTVTVIAATSAPDIVDATPWAILPENTRSKFITPRRRLFSTFCVAAFLM